MSLDGNTEWIALSELKDELTELVKNDEAPSIIAKYNERYVQVLEAHNGIDQAQSMMDLIDLVSQQPSLNTRFQELRDRVDDHRWITSHLVELSHQLGLEEEQALRNALSNNHLRIVTLYSAGIGPAKSIKVENIEFDLGEFAQLAASILLAVYGLNSKPNPLFVSALFLVVLASIYKASTREISEQEASVFWGLVASSGVETTAHIDSIVEHTNAERARVNLPPLAQEQVLSSLGRLEQIETVSRVSDSSIYWKATEHYKVRKK